MKKNFVVFWLVMLAAGPAASLWAGERMGDAAPRQQGSGTA